MDLRTYRENPREKERVTRLLSLVPKRGRVLDVGARDGHLSLKLTEIVDSVVALDLTKPELSHAAVIAVEGNVTDLKFDSGEFDTVLCAEVLEHITPNLLSRACEELARVTRENLIIGVPYKQDIRLGRSTCYSCGGINPPWGHVNSFDERTLKDLFPGLRIAQFDFVGVGGRRTNWLSAFLMDYAGNPYGTYEQEEVCIHCGMHLVPPPRRTTAQRIATRLAVTIDRGVNAFVFRVLPNWMHARLVKP